MSEREIFAGALLRADPTERAAFVDAACGDNAPLRERVRTLLAFHEVGESVLDRRPPGAPAGEQGDDAPGETVVRSLAPFLAPAARPDSLGRLGHYHLLEVLGHGGCGVVFRALDDKLQRVVAVKVLAPHLAATSPPRQRFLREARAVAQVRDEHVVQVYAVEEEPLPYLVMEFVGGETLQNRLDRVGPLPAAEVIRLGRQVALGLAAAHEKGLIHRDVKPANVLLDGGPEPRTRLTDFGLARAADDASLTRSGVLAGTPMYMSPEQARGGEVLDHRTDLFSLGSLLYTLAAGRPPFRAATALAVLKRVAEDAPRPLREVIAGLPPGLVAVIDRLMAKDPAARYASAREAADALGQCLTAPPARGRGRGRRLPVAAAVVFLAVGIGWAASHLARPAVTGTPAGPPPAELGSPPAVVPVAAPAGPQTTPADPVPANAIVVTSVADDDSSGTLRWAVEQANARPGEDTVVFDPAVFAEPQTIALTRGELRLTDPALTTILGPAAGVKVSGKVNNNQRAFSIHAASGSPAAATIRGLTIADCNLGTGNGSRGAAVLVGNNADVVLDRVTVTGNFCNFGGGVFCDGTLRISNSTFTRNSSSGGGAILSYGTLTVVNSTFSENHSNGSGGGIQVSGGSAKIISSTFTANSAGRGGGAVCNEFDEVPLTLANTIAAGNKCRTAPDLAGSMTATSCLIGSTAGLTLLPGSGRNVTGESPRLGPLARNGGPTETHLLLADSPAIDAGDAGAVPANVRTDQRGRPRVAGVAPDIGAVERD